MKKLDKFILLSFIGPFFAILFIVIFVLMMQFLWLYIDELVGKGLAVSVILEFLFWGACTILPLSLPLSTLLAGMMTMGQLAENNELMAIKASGVSVTRVMLPLIVASFIISVAAFFTSNDLVPYSYNQIYTLRDDIGKTKEEIKIPDGTFYNGIEGFTLRVDHTDEQTGVMRGIMVYDHSSSSRNTALTLADSATMVMSEAKDYLTFTMYNGVSYSEDNTYNYRDTSFNLSQMDFDRQALVISLKNYAFQKSDGARYGDQIKSMRLGQLRHENDSLTLKSGEVHSVQMSSFLSNGHLLKHKQIDTSYLNRGIRPAEFPKDKWKEAWNDATSVERARKKADDAISDLERIGRENSECHYYIRRTEFEILKKFAGALACFILFFIGAPLGALIHKGGLGTPAVISVLFFVLYWVVDISGSKLSNDGAISPAAGAFISTIVLTPIGIFLTNRTLHDSSLNMDGFKTEWRKILSRIVRVFRKTRIVYMGTPEFAVAPLDNLIKKGYKIVGVVTVADKPSGRGLKVNESAVKRYAVEHEIPVLQPVRLKDPEFLESLKAWKADLFVVVAFRMLPEEVWSMPGLGTFNLHAALLPQYRGSAPINWAVINGETLSGVTTFMIDKGVDTGGIIFRQEHRIGPEDTAGDLHDALMDKGAELVTDTVEAIIQRNVETRVQRSFIQGSEILKPAPKLTRELCHIDWDDSTSHICNLIRGLSPYPAAYTEICREGGAPVQLKIFKACPGEHRTENAEPGAIITDGSTFLEVKTADASISIKEVQLSGKKRMDVHDFLNGFRDMEKCRLSKGSSKEECLRLQA